MKSFQQYIAEDLYTKTADCSVCRGTGEYPAGQECRDCEGTGRTYLDDMDWSLERPSTSTTSVDSSTVS